MSTVYFTTPLYYVNSVPHLGSTYTTVVGDALARYHRLFGNDVKYLTGTDEHGQKIQNAATAAGKDPQAYVDEIVGAFEDAWKAMEISHDIFMRTTFDYHKKAVQNCLQKLLDKGDIYTRTYGGWYCVAEEIFVQEKDVVDGKCPMGHKVTHIEEKNYFFKMSKYQERLIEHIKNNSDFILPSYRANEVLGFLRQPLEDLCISRPKSRLAWGIELPFDKDYVTYVWFDALLNYATAVGLDQPAKNAEFKKYWPNAVHLIGKDILTTHAVYWSTMLMALEEALPRTIFAHGWLLSPDNQKMSKSFGNVKSPAEISAVVGVEPFRYFLVRDIGFGNDAQFSMDLVVQRINTELANNLGNLLSRSTNLVGKYFDGKIPEAPSSPSEATVELSKLAASTAGLVRTSIEALEPHKAIGSVMDLLNAANKYMEDRAPWKQAKTDLSSAGESLYTTIEILRIAGSLLIPTMPEKMAALLRIIGAPEKPAFSDLSKWGLLKPGTAVSKPEPLFPRIEIPKE